MQDPEETDLTDKKIDLLTYKQFSCIRIVFYVIFSNSKTSVIPDLFV